MRPLVPLVLVPAVVACSGAPSDPDDAVDPLDTLEVPDGLTWYRDIEPLAYQHCVSCHHADGIGPGDWTDPAQVSVWAPAMADAVRSRRMPLPAADPACRDYVGSERIHMPDTARALLVGWADQGAALGDEADRASDLQVHLPRLDDADLTLAPPAAHTLSLDGSGNEYWCVVLDNPLTSPRFITGFDVDLDAPGVVHHMLLAVDAHGDAGIEYGTDGRTRAFRCQSQVVESDWNILHAWTPGMEPVVFPTGYGMRIAPGDQLVLQMHYFGDPTAQVTDGSTYRLRTQATVDRQVVMSTFGPSGFRIPPDAEAHSDEDGIDNPADRPVQVLGAFPHMHLLGSAFEAWLEAPRTEDTCLMRGPYDFDHQLTYMFREPALLAVGGRAMMRCTWDNSASNPRQYNDPPRWVTYGEGSNEEMCYLLTYVAP
ncbi:MAG: hypothetical protein H6733_03145 [Alphaproteobacteria bacterium]|nr:hypothetical protein [Alphaproteobacteria bacterium]